ncbi:MAG TPA: hypothetical protein VED84_04370 [Acidimicrobiales bacterium]|nr:hypothetical protein [Acidimicrobiales bacterium]
MGHRSLKSRARAAAATGTVLTMLLAGDTAVAALRAPTAVPPLPVTTSHFYAVWSVSPSEKQVIEEFSAVTGQPARDVLDLPRPVGTTLLEDTANDLVQASDGWIWFTKTSGPADKYTGYGPFVPVPNSCSGRVVRLNPETGQVKTVFRMPRSVLLDAAVPSPNGRYVVYQAAPCDQYFNNSHFAVRDLATGRQWTIGEDARVCHDLSAAAWTVDSDELVFTYGSSTVGVGASADWGYGSCPMANPDELAIVSALHTASIRSVSLTAAPKGCQYVDAVTDAWGTLALQSCGGIVDSRTSLVQLTDHSKVLGQWGLGPNWDGISLSASPDGRLVLIGEYSVELNAATGTNHPTYGIEVFNGSRLRLIRRFPTADTVTEAVW